MSIIKLLKNLKIDQKSNFYFVGLLFWYIFANKIESDIVFIFGKDTKIKRKTKNKSKKMIMTPILTDAQKRRTLRDAKLYKEYLELTAIPENSRTGIMQLLMKKYEIGSTATYYAIINRKGGQQ